MGEISRNDQCPCGSRLKYKKCCLKNNNDKTAIQDLRSKKELVDRVTQRVGRKIIVKELLLGEAKMSEIVLEFSGSLIQQAKTDATIHAAIDIACFAWNLSFFDEAEKEKCLNMVSSKLGSKNLHANKEAINAINELIQCKLTYYSHINRYIFDYKISWFEKNFKLNIISSAYDVKEINLKN